MKFVIAYLTVILGFWSCTSKFKGYTSINPELHYRLIKFDDNCNENIHSGDYVLLQFVLLDSLNKKIYWQNISNYLKVSKNDFFFPLFTDLNPNDSIEIITKGKHLNELKINRALNKESFYTLQLIVKKVLTEKEYKNYLEKQADIEEMINYQKYLNKHHFEIDSQYNFYVDIQPSDKGELVEKGKIVQIAYKAYFLDENLFDSTKKEEPLEITYGVSNQVIKGIELVLNKMKTNDRATLIFPSVYGFGDKGSSSGLVPPFTTLKYQIEIINVKDPQEL